MSDDVLGKATIMMVADQGGFNADMIASARTVAKFGDVAVDAAAKSSAALTSMGDASTQASGAMSVSQQRFVQSLQRQVAAMEGGKLAALALKAEQMGLAGAAAPLIDRMRQVEITQKAAAAASEAMSGGLATASAAVNSFAESEDQAATRIRSMVAASLEQTEALNKQTAAAREAATAARNVATSPVSGTGVKGDFSSSQHGMQETANQIADVNRALANIGRGASSMKEVQAQTDKLLGLWQTGRISAEQYEVAVKRLDASEAALAKSSADAAASANAFIAKLKDQAATAGLTSKQLMEYRAAQLGVTAQAAPFIEKIGAGEKALHSFSLESGGARRELAVVARELARGDFGAAARSMSILSERSGLTAMMMSPLGLAVGAAAGAFALLGYEAYASHQQLEEVNKSIASSGSFAGLTADQVAGMSTQLAGSTRFVGQANEALVGLVNTGRIGGDQLASFGQVALEMAKDTGKSIADVTSDLGALADDAVAWAEKYQKQHHFMSAAQYELAVQYADTGDKAGAAKVVIDALHESHQRMTAGATKDMSFVMTVWEGWKRIIIEVDGLLARAVGPSTYASQMEAAQGKYRGDFMRLGQLKAAPGGGNKQLIDQLQAAVDADQKELGRLNDLILKDQGKAKENQAIGKSGDQAMALRGYLNDTKYADSANRQRIEKDNEKKAFAAATEGLKEGSAEYESAYARHQANLKKIEESYKDKGAAKPKAFHDDAATKFLQSLREQEATLQAQVVGEGKLTEAQRERIKFEQQIADIKEKRVLTADQKSLLANQDAIRAQLDKNVAAAEELRIKQEKQKLDERSAQINEAIKSQRDGQQEQYGRTLGAFGMGKAEQDRVTAYNQIQKEYQRYQEQLTKATPKELLGTQEFQDAQSAIADGLAGSLKDYENYYSQLKDKQGDWRNGAMQSFYDYQDAAQNVAAQAGSAFTNAAKGMEDALVNFAMTGKLSFSDLAKSVIADIARMQAKAAISGLFNFAVGLASSYFGSTSSYGATDGAQAASGGSFTVSPQFKAEGGLISGPGTGTSDSIAAWLSNGEFVNNAESTKKNRGLLEWLNKGGDGSKLGRFASGGMVGSGSMAAVTAAVGAAAGITVITNVTVAEGGTKTETTGDSSAFGKQFGTVLTQAIKDALVKESRDGGILSKQRMGYG
jgi:lambda family phage tail tape measure protein